MGTPTLCLENLPKNFEVGEKSFFWTCATFEAGGGPEKKLCPPHGLVRIDAHGEYFKQNFDFNLKTILWWNSLQSALQWYNDLHIDDVDCTIINILEKGNSR